jgi:hypothetical protein
LVDERPQTSRVIGESFSVLALLLLSLSTRKKARIVVSTNRTETKRRSRPGPKCHPVYLSSFRFLSVIVVIFRLLLPRPLRTATRLESDEVRMTSTLASAMALARAWFSAS